MSLLLIASLLAATAALLASPRGLARLRIRQPPDWLLRLWRGQPTAPPLQLRIVLATLIAIGLVVWLPSWWGALAATAGWLAAVVGLGFLTGGRGRHSSTEATAQGLELLAVALTAGMPMNRALRVINDAAPRGSPDALSRVLAQLELGQPAWQAWLVLAEDGYWGMVAKDISRACRTGTALVETLQVHAEEIRLRRQEAAMRRAKSVGVASVIPLLVCFLPAFIMVGVVPIVGGLFSAFFGQ